MDTAQQPAVPKTYIAEWIKLDFFNDSNLKGDIQNRISPIIEQTFIEALNEMRGDNKNGYGTSFSEITLSAMAYFYSEIFTDKIKDSYYTLTMVKGFLDANNHTPYTAIREIDVKFYKLKMNKRVYDIILEQELFTKEELDELLKPENMVNSFIKETK